MSSSVTWVSQVVEAARVIHRYLAPLDAENRERALKMARIMLEVESSEEEEEEEKPKTETVKK